MKLKYSKLNVNKITQKFIPFFSEHVHTTMGLVKPDNLLFQFLCNRKPWSPGFWQPCHLHCRHRYVSQPLELGLELGNHHLPPQAGCVKAVFGGRHDIPVGIVGTEWVCELWPPHRSIFVKSCLFIIWNTLLWTLQYVVENDICSFFKKKSVSSHLQLITDVRAILPIVLSLRKKWTLEAGLCKKPSIC